MSEQTPETPTPEAPVAQEQPAQPVAPERNAAPSEESPEDSTTEAAWDPERAREKIRKVNSENKALRERATQAEETAATVPDLQQQTQTLGSENLRLRVGYELGLPFNLAIRLQGSTREEMIADAESLVELVSPARPAPTSGRPVESLRPGASPEPVTPIGSTDYPSHWFPKARTSDTQSGA
jgi:hypothetical protein